MAGLFGNALQIAAMLLGVLGIATGSRRIFYASAVLVIGAFALLVGAFASSDFSLQNVFLNSSTIKPLVFKIAGSWSSHEGSMLLWIALFSFISIIAVKAEERILRLQLALQTLFLSFLYFTSNPFFTLSFVPQEGLGLNPMLQDKALAIHPPTLYLGYVLSSVPFSIAIRILLDGKCDHVMLRISKSFLTGSMFFMTLGIGLGSWWAYRELGWGGFWFFDPVENVSIIPWFAAIALYHSLVITMRNGQLLHWTISLSLVVFILTVLGTLLVRSGILTSVHSFAFSPERGQYMLLVFSVISVPSFVLLSTRTIVAGNILRPDNQESKANIIALGNIAWVTILLVLLCATIYPIIYSALHEETVTVDESFFYRIFLPCLIPVLVLPAMFSHKFLRHKYLINITISIIPTALCYYAVELSWREGLFSFAGIFLMTQTIAAVCAQTYWFKRSLSLSRTSMAFGHFGIGMLALSIALHSAMQQEIEFIGQIGETLTSESGINVKLNNVYFAEGANYYRQIAEFWITDAKGNITILKPENRLYKVEQMLSQESDIYSYLTEDLYAVLSHIDGNVIHAKIYLRPMISFLWMSIMLICAAFVVRIF